MRKLYKVPSSKMKTDATPVLPPPRYLMCPPRKFSLTICRPWDRSQGRGLQRPGVGRHRFAAMGGAAPRPAGRRRRGRIDRARAGSARPGLHRERGRGVRRQGAARPVPPCRAPGRAAGVRGRLCGAAGARPDRRNHRDAGGHRTGRRGRLYLRPAPRPVLDGLRVPLGRSRARVVEQSSGCPASRCSSPNQASITSTPRFARCHAVALYTIRARSRRPRSTRSTAGFRPSSASRSIVPTPRGLRRMRSVSAM